MSTSQWKDMASSVNFGVESQRNLADLNEIASEIIKNRNYDAVLKCFEELLSIAGMEQQDQLVEKEKRLDEIREKIARERIELLKEGNLLRGLRETNDAYIEKMLREIEDAQRYCAEDNSLDPWQQDVSFRKDVIGKRSQEMLMSKKVAESFSLQIKMAEDHCYRMAEKIWDAQVNFLPLLRSRITMESGKTAMLQVRKMIRDSLRDIEKV